jgi:UDP-glucose 4-epimerase
MARSPLSGPATVVRGNFTWPEDTAQLDQYAVDVLIHLAAETGDATEEASLFTNVLGTRRLLRYLVDRGCRRFILASSIAAVGTNDARFIPRSVPIDEDEPLSAFDPYGLSKGLMEQLVQYFHRRNPETEFTVFRFGWVRDEATWAPPPLLVGSPIERPFLDLGLVMVGDVLRGLSLAVEQPLGPGVRILNLVAPDAACDDPVADVLSAALGERGAGLDLSHYRRPGHEFDALFAMEGMKLAYGFEPRLSVRPTAIAAASSSR